MLNEERIRLMTKMASYEANEGKRNATIGNYYRSDYISKQVIKSFLCATIAFIVVLAMIVFYDFEIFMSDIYNMDLLQLGKSVLVAYVLTTLAYCIISYLVYTHRYASAKKKLKTYYNNLKKLAYLYYKETKK